MATRQDFFMSKLNELKKLVLYFVVFFICPLFGWTFCQENLSETPKVILSDSVASSYHFQLTHKAFDTLKKPKVKTFYNTAFKHNYTNNSHVNVEKIDKKLVQEWIESKVEELSTMDLNHASIKKIKASFTIFNEFYQLEYRVKGSGLIKFDNGESVYLVCHSFHENEKIGDITIAMTQNKNFYYNMGHICGSVISFKTNHKVNQMNNKYFFENFVSDTDGLSWFKIK